MLLIVLCFNDYFCIIVLFCLFYICVLCFCVGDFDVCFLCCVSYNKIFIKNLCCIFIRD